MLDGRQKFMVANILAAVVITQGVVFVMIVIMVIMNSRMTV